MSLPFVLIFRALAACAVVAHAFAAVKLAAPFRDHMVLQRDMPVPIWGTAAPGAAVVVEFAGQSHIATTDVRGQWRVTLRPLVMSAQPQALVVRGRPTITVSDILVGEVWLCAGQSNMEVGLERLKTTHFKTAAAKAETLELVTRELDRSTPEIRLIRFNPNRNDPHRGQWLPCERNALINPAIGAQGFSAVGYFFGQALHEKLQVPIGLMSAALGGTVIEPWLSPHGKHFRALLEPVLPFPIRGVLWYQGESDVIAGDTGENYAGKFEALIEGWRARWGIDDLPFYFVQLPPMAYSKRRGSQLLTTEALPQFREGQARALRLPHTGMVVTTDLAAAADLHPTNKWDVGRRLARLALAQTYGRTDVVASGPVFRSMEKTGNKLVVKFDHVHGGLVSSDSGPLRNFLIAGGDQRFVPSEAVIAGSTVVVSNPSVPDPTSVRFAWHEDARPNLFNAAGLPAAPFRTDDWPVTIVRAGASDNGEPRPSRP